VVEEVTGSKFGFIGEIGSDGLLHDIGISDPGWRACKMEDATGHRVNSENCKIHGLYGKVFLDEKPFFSNTPASHPSSIGTPAGHPAIDSFLGVPLINRGRTVGLVALANRHGGYRDEDLRALELLANAFVQALERKRAEKERSEYRNLLEAKVAERTAELMETNTALKVLLKKREEDRRELEEQMAFNIKQLVEPNCLFSNYCHFIESPKKVFYFLKD